MFTGIISDIGTITKASHDGELRLEISCSFAPETIKIGDSIACSGVCLTVIEILDSGFAVELSAETIACTAPNMWNVGNKLNLERAMRLGDTLDGNLVTGHVDGLATLENIAEAGGSHILTLSAPPALSRFIAQKGSVTLDGVSLTVNKVEGDRFWINIIPHTWTHTTICMRKTGDKINIEIDTIARYVARILEK